MNSARLRYEALREDLLDTLLTLAHDAHIRRYLLDGKLVDEAWPRVVLDRTVALRGSHPGLDLFVVYDGAEPVGFCGYFVFEDIGQQPQLFYALREPWTGMGLATEMGQALIASADGVLSPITAAVDAPNTASIRVLEKLGFAEVRRTAGAFGETIVFSL